MIELLSPVGNEEMLYQAVHNGADAVYLAGTNYGARKFSNNFTNDELVSVIKYCHLYGVKVYITVNTIIYEKEIDDFINYIEFIYKNGVDALIIQDIGMINLIRNRFSNLELHASTQCHIHNEESMLFYKNMGVKRVVLARELSLDQIKGFKCDIDKEIFIHGALCVSYSGCCLFSSLNGGRSGNRGECVGSCRLPYSLYKDNKKIALESKYLLSTKELNTLDSMDKILDSNIKSLKIEGRMKSPYYVGLVTKLYRSLIDKYYNNEDLKLSSEDIVNLKKIYNRKFTSGYLMDNLDIMNIDSSNHQGIEIGKIIKVNKKYITIKLSNELNQGDAIRFKESDKGMFVNKLFDSKLYLKNSIDRNNICVVENKLNIKTKDIVLKTIDIKLEDKLKKYDLKKINIDFKIILKIGCNMILSVFDGVNYIEEVGSLVDKAIKREVTDGDIENSLSKLGNTPFKLNNLTIIKDDNIFVSLKDINVLRRGVIDKLINKREQLDRDIVIKDIKDNYNYQMASKCCLNVLVRNEEQLKCCLDNEVDSIYVTDYSLYCKYQSFSNIYYRTPRTGLGYKSFKNKNLLVGDTGAIIRYGVNNNLVSDYYLNVVNSYSIKYLLSNNVKRVTLSVELNDNEIRDILLKTKFPVELIIYGRLELMVTKYCPLKKCLNNCSICKNDNSKYCFEDKSNKKYPIVHENCITHIMHHSNINKIDNIKNYKDMGVCYYRLELFDENYETLEKYIKEVKSML